MYISADIERVESTDLPRSTSADNGDLLSRGNLQRKTLENRLIRNIAEPNIFQFNRRRRRQNAQSWRARFLLQTNADGEWKG